MSTRSLLFMVGAFLFLQFIFFSYLVHKDLFTQFDFNTTVRLQDRIPPKFDPVFSLLSDVGKFEVLTIVLLVILVFLRNLKLGIVAFAAYIGIHLFEIYGKWFVNHPPPPQFMLRTEQMLNFPQFHVRAEYSYPSGHSGRTIFLAVLFLLLLWRKNRLPMVIKVLVTVAIVGFSLTMLISRISLGEHWTTDVIGGSILGAAMGLFTGMFLFPAKHPPHHQSEKKRMIPKFKIEIKKVE